MRTIGWIGWFATDTTAIATATMINCAIATRMNMIRTIVNAIDRSILTAIVIDVAVIVVVDGNWWRWCRMKIS